MQEKLDGIMEELRRLEKVQETVALQLVQLNAHLEHQNQQTEPSESAAVTV